MTIMIRNRIPARFRRRESGSDRWIPRLLLLLFGAFLIVMGIVGVNRGNRWTVVYHPIFDQAQLAPTIGFCFIGFLFVVLGAIPWGRGDGSKR